MAYPYCYYNGGFVTVNFVPYYAPESVPSPYMFAADEQWFDHPATDTELEAVFPGYIAEKTRRDNNYAYYLTIVNTRADVASDSDILRRAVLGYPGAVAALQGAEDTINAAYAAMVPPFDPSFNQLPSAPLSGPTFAERVDALDTRVTALETP